MQIDNKKLDIVYLAVLIVSIVGLPLAIWAYDNYFWRTKVSPEANVFTLTGHTEKGWILGDVGAADILFFTKDYHNTEKPVIHVRKGDLVVFRLKSMDVIHGFSFKDAAIIITDGIEPGKVTTVTFVAEKEGSFTFSCNAICGDNHQNMQGTVVVTA